MLKIGEFSKLSRVSIRMLRRYNEVGLLLPAETDPITGYRYYSEDQLPAAGRITALRDMGFSLADGAIADHIYSTARKICVRAAGLCGFCVAARRSLSETSTSRIFRARTMWTPSRRRMRGACRRARLRMPPFPI